MKNAARKNPPFGSIRKKRTPSIRRIAGAKCRADRLLFRQTLSFFAKNLTIQSKYPERGRPWFIRRNRAFSLLSSPPRSFVRRFAAARGSTTTALYEEAQAIVSAAKAASGRDPLAPESYLYNYVSLVAVCDGSANEPVRNERTALDERMTVRCCPAAPTVRDSATRSIFRQASPGSSCAGSDILGQIAALCMKAAIFP